MSTDGGSAPGLSAQLDEALELDPANRALWLAELERCDAPRARQLRAALAAREHHEFADFLAGPSPWPRPEEAEATLIGRTVGPYRIDAEIGRGGMGSVWRARRADGRYEGTVALKFVHAAWIGQSGEQRFRTEGTLLGRLDHPHIARLLDAGLLEGTQPYLVLEYVEGVPIDVYCQSHGLGTEARIRLFLSVLDAVAHAHSHLIVHRDLKPSNIFVTRDGVVKLLDFGIAKLLDEGTGLGAPTRSSATALTPQYAAPEQLLGQAVTTVTDVYALGLVLYELLTGRHPNAAAARSRIEIVKAVVTEVPAAASSIGEVPTVPRRTLAGDLDNILHKALKKHPAERYASVGALADDLQRVLQHQPVLARADSLTYRTGKFVRRHRGGVAAGVLVAVAIVAGVIGTLSQARRATEQAQQAALQARRAQHERDRALREVTYTEAANEFVNFLLGQGSRERFTTTELLARADAQSARQFATDPALRGRLQLMIGNAYALAGVTQPALDILGRAQLSAAQTTDVGLAATIDCTLADVNVDGGNMELAQQLFSRALLRLRAAPEPDTAALTSCLTMRGEMEAIRGDGKAALASGQEALRWLGTPRPGQRSLAVDAHTTVGEAYGRLGQVPRAIQEYETAMQELAAMGRDRTSNAAVTLNNLAAKYSVAGRFLQALAHYRTALDINTDAVGRGHVGPLEEANYATSLYDNGRTREALAIYEHALGNARRQGQKLWGAYIQLMAVPAQCAAHQLERCAQWLQAANAELLKSMPAGHGVFGVVAMDRGRLDMARHAWEAARVHLQRSLELLGSKSNPQPTRVTALGLLVRCDSQLGDAASAQRHAQQALDAAQALHSSFDHTVWLGSAYLAQAIALQAQGNAEAARQALRQAQVQLADSEGAEASEALEVHALLRELNGAG